MVIQQRITTYWTKASRGGQAAALRNAVPETLPARHLQAHFSENSGFQFSESSSGAIGELMLKYEEAEEGIIVYYAGICGVPGGQVHPKKIFQLFRGEWGQVIANCRGVSGEDIWTYGKHVINIYVGDKPCDDVFTASQPAHYFSDLKKLY